MATALCCRPEPLGAGERSLRAAPGATIRCGASRQPPRRLGGGCHASGASYSLPPTHRAGAPLSRLGKRAPAKQNPISDVTDEVVAEKYDNSCLDLSVIELRCPVAFDTAINSMKTEFISHVSKITEKEERTKEPYIQNCGLSCKKYKKTLKVFMSAYHLISNTIIHMCLIEQIFIEDLYASNIFCLGAETESTWWTSLRNGDLEDMNG
nr:uncharacterized protein LOC112132319 [Pongo abelii]